MGEKSIRSIDPVWEDIHSKREWGKYPSEDAICFFCRNFPDRQQRKGIKVLDFGCGQGANTWFLAREGFDTYGFDGAPSAVAKAQARLQFEKCEATVSVQDALHLDYVDNMFDAVLDNAVIYANSMENISCMYQVIHRILKSGGKLFTSGHFSEQTTGYGTGTELENNTFTGLTYGPLFNRGTVHFFNEDTLCKCLQSAGFSEISIDRHLYTRYGGTETIEYLMASCVKQ